MITLKNQILEELEQAYDPQPLDEDVDYEG